MTDPAVLRSLRAAVDAAPADVALRLHLAELLVAAGNDEEALAQVAVALQHEPGSGPARALMARILAGPPTAPAPQDRASQPPAPQAPALQPPAGGSPAMPRNPPAPPEFDWRRAEEELGVPLEAGEPGDDHDPAFDVERPSLTLDDVGGMAEVKERLHLSFLGPMRNPQMRALYGKSLRGGLLLYGPPGCGKTYLARALAGEMGAAFLSVALTDVLDMWLGNSERNLHRLFRQARAKAPCVVFLDELDAIGMKRTLTRNSGTRTTVQQLLVELDGTNGDNEGVFVLAATNAPWDVDPALRRPGRLDRTVLVLPPDLPAREAILGAHLAGRPVAGVDLGRLAKRTDGLSGADLAHVCETATELAMADSLRTGSVRPIGARDLEAALAQVRPSTGAWFEAARNVALYANEGGAYDELVAHLRKRRML